MNHLSFRNCPNIKPSVPEVIIAQKLKERKIRFVQEVTFDGCKNPITGCLLRFDFFLPELNMLIEYDGIASHSTDAVMRRDRVKNEFARTNKIKLIRVQGIQNIEFLFSEHIEKAERVTNPISGIITKPKKKRNIKPERITVSSAFNGLLESVNKPVKKAGHNVGNKFTSKNRRNR